ncbi:ATP-NAD kinase family protein [Thermogladius sp. 4427co]|uniref:ATP-NAD kinase family protein n=1 Tax=Thermogladius sp. 4427co TaxID=3450718 RepID=UPI003F7A3811
MARIGFIVNPYAGLGGRLGLKGTDEYAITRALSLGYGLIAPRRAIEFLSGVTSRNFRIITAAGLMGEYEVYEAGLADLVEEIVGERKNYTSRYDTVNAARTMADRRVDLIVFVGGDGTLKDLMEAVGTRIPLLGVPSGVKVYSSAFAYTPRHASAVLDAFVQGKTEVTLAEVVDVDEELFRKDRLSLKIYGYVKALNVEGLLQPSKNYAYTTSDEENKIAIARYLAENMDDNAYYILGPGSTVKALRYFIDGELSLLGVDVVFNRRVILRDTWEKPLLELLSKGGVFYIIVSPIGRQGFIFGRGNQQISPEVLKLIPRENIVVVATKSKISEIDYLRIDTGDPVVDEKLRGYYKVLVDYGEYVVKKAV